MTTWFQAWFESRGRGCAGVVATAGGVAGEVPAGGGSVEDALGREGTPAEIASLISWLLGPDGGWMTGQVLSPNGGVVLGR